MKDYFTVKNNKSLLANIQIYPNYSKQKKKKKQTAENNVECRSTAF